MTLTPILSAPFAVQLHVAAASLALLLGPYLLLGGRRVGHRLLGTLWVTSMALTALSSFWISGFHLIGPFSPIHLLSAYALYGLWQGMAHILRGEVRAHRAVMSQLYWYAVLVAGIFTLLPGRRVNAMLFADAPAWGYAPIGVGGALLVWRATRSRKRPAQHT